MTTSLMTLTGEPVFWALVAAVASLGAAVALLGAMLAWRSGRLAKRRAELIAETLEALPYARLVADRDGRAVYANVRWRSQLGFDPASPLAPLRVQIGGEAEGLAQLDRLARAAADGGQAEAEIMVRTPAGAFAWRRISVYPLARHPGHSLWGVEDVTSQHEMEEIIREEQEKLIDFLENAPIGFYSVDEDGEFQFINNTLAGWLGYTPEEVMAGGRRLHEFVGGPARSGRPAYTPFGDRAHERRGEVTLVGKDRAFQAFVTQTVVQNEDGTGMRTRSLVRDLTAEREWAEALRLSEQRFHRFFEEAPVGIVLLDIDGTVIECNPAFAEIVVTEPAGAVGKPLRLFIAEPDREGVARQLAEAVRGGDRPAPTEVRLGPSGNRVASFAFRRLEDGGGRVTGLILHIQDLTERKSLEAQFMQSQKMELIGQLAGGVAHDFNNLLTAIIGFCDLLLLRHGPGDPSFADIKQIQQNSNRAANLVRQLLAFSRQQTLQPRVLNLTDVLAELSNLLRRLIGASVELKLVHGREIAPVKVDQGQFDQVIINLAVNARDAMTDGGTLTIRTGKAAAGDERLVGQGLDPAEFVSIEVADTGCGMPPEVIEKIYEPFYTTKEVGSGTGLGLSTVYGIVRQTGGHIFVDSAIGRGTTFTIFLPRHQAEHAAAGPVRAETREQPARRDLTGAGTVLLVEDEDAVRKFGARALRNKGYTVIEAHNGEAALEILGKGSDEIDILITDVVMPGLDGPGLIRKVRITRPDMKVIFISGYTEDSFRQRLGTDSDIHFLPKPFSLQQLAGKVKEVIHATP